MQEVSSPAGSAAFNRWPSVLEALETKVRFSRNVLGREELRLMESLIRESPPSGPDRSRLNGLLLESLLKPSSISAHRAIERVARLAVGGTPQLEHADLPARSTRFVVDDSVARHGTADELETLQSWLERSRETLERLPSSVTIRLSIVSGCSPGDEYSTRNINLAMTYTDVGGKRRTNRQTILQGGVALTSSALDTGFAGFRRIIDLCAAAPSIL